MARTMELLFVYLLLIGSWFSIVYSIDYWEDQTYSGISPRMGYSTTIVHSPYFKNTDDLANKPNQNTNSYIQSGSSKIVENYSAPKPEDDSQMIRVGYSVKFRNSNNDHEKSNDDNNSIYKSRNTPKYSPKYAKNADNGEIITGKRKENEEVEAPNDALSPQEFVSQALSKQRHLISGIKPKYHYPEPSTTGNPLESPERLINQANFSPKTQKYIKALEKVKVTRQSNKNINQNEYHNWSSIGPGVEIIKSSEIPVSANIPTGRGTQNDVNRFNHKLAVSNSERFDMSDALHSSDFIEAQNTQQTEAKTEEDSAESDESRENNDSQYSTEQYITSTFKPIVKTGKVFRIPVDTSLIREPVITTNLQQFPNDPRMLPIHFDITPIENAIKSQQNAAASSIQEYSTTIDQEHPLYSYKNADVENKLLQSSNRNIRFNQYAPNYMPYEKHVKNSQPENQDHASSFSQIKLYGIPHSIKYKNPSSDKTRKTANIKYYNERSRQPRYGVYHGEMSDFRPPSYFPSIFQKSHYY